MEEFRRFLAVANAGGISRAAAQLHVSQPALSRSITLLEERFGARLFTRTALGVELTESGILLYEHANRAISTINAAEEEIHYAHRQRHQSLSICSGDAWGYGILPTVIRAFSAANPNVTIRIDIVDIETRINGLRNGTYDLAFGVVSPKFETADNHVFLPMVRAPYDVYCDRRHPLVGRSRYEIADLLSYPWINHKFEYDFDIAKWRNTGRNYLIRANTMLNVIEIMRDSQFLISTAKSFREIFERSGIIPLTEDAENRDFISGAIYIDRPPLRPVPKKFLRDVTTHCFSVFGPFT